MQKRVGRILLVGAGALAAVAVAGRDKVPGRALRRALGVVARRVRDAEGRLEGVRYRLAGRTPEPDVTDDVLADRVRSSLGRLERHLDVPRVHIMVEDGIAVLHGPVPSPAEAAAIEHAVSDVVGVRGVESYLHVGLGAGDTRPSTGRVRAEAAPSAALRQLLDSARHAGATEDGALPAVRAVLATFADRIPADEAGQLLAHLPDDVRALAEEPRRHGEHVARLRTVPDLVAAIASHGEIDPERAYAIAESVLGRVRELVPEEVADVAAVLPDELRQFWTAAVPG